MQLSTSADRTKLRLVRLPACQLMHSSATRRLSPANCRSIKIVRCAIRCLSERVIRIKCITAAVQPSAKPTNMKTTLWSPTAGRTNAGQAGQHHLQRHDHDPRRPLVRLGRWRTVVGGSRHRCRAQRVRLSEGVYRRLQPQHLGWQRLTFGCVGRAEHAEERSHVTAARTGNLSHVQKRCQRPKRGKIVLFFTKSHWATSRSAFAKLWLG